MSTAIDMPAGRLWAAYFNEMRFEFLKSLRTPAFAVPTLFFPIMFYLLFGVLLGSMRGNTGMAQYAFATYGVFGAMGPGLFGFGVSLAIEREQGLLLLKQALPQPPGAYLLARAAMAMLFVAIISLLLLAAAVLMAKVPLTAGQAVQLFFINVLGALPFCAIGLFVGSWVSGQASPAIVNLIFLPMAFLSGLWWPLQFMPQFLQDIAPTWPAYHLAQMALAAVGAPSKGSALGHVAVLAGVTLFFFLLAVRRMHGGGFRLLGAHPKRSLALLAGGAAAVLALFLAGVLGDKPANTEVATAATEAASATTGTPASTAPAGVPAPAISVIADFDRGTDRTPYGTGMMAAGDERQGGSSTAAQRLVDGGAEGSKGALEVSGELRAGAQYPFAGTFFFPEGPPMEGLMDYSSRKTLSFQARGDGKRYTFMLFSGTTMGIPLMYGFTAGPEWRKYELNITDYSAHDFKRVRGMAFGAMGENGPFQFQLDDVRFE
jgi:ABC-2 type transport system permease protein